MMKNVGQAGLKRVMKMLGKPTESDEKCWSGV